MPTLTQPFKGNTQLSDLQISGALWAYTTLQQITQIIKFSDRIHWLGLTFIILSFAKIFSLKKTSHFFFFNIAENNKTSNNVLFY